MKVELNEIFSILRECAYEFDECNSAEECIENLIVDILDNIGEQSGIIFQTIFTSLLVKQFTKVGRFVKNLISKKVLTLQG